MVLFWFNHYYPTFMLGIWCGSDFLKERFGSSQNLRKPKKQLEKQMENPQHNGYAGNGMERLKPMSI